MRSVLLIAAALAFAVVTACTPAAPQPDLILPASSGDAAARTSCEARGSDACAYELEIALHLLSRGRYAIEVQNRDITSARVAAPGAPASESRLERLVTVNRLLDVIRQASAADTQVRATYNPRIGYPVYAEIGLHADDSSTLYRITNLHAL